MAEPSKKRKDQIVQRLTEIGSSTSQAAGAERAQLEAELGGGSIVDPRRVSAGSSTTPSKRDQILGDIRAGKEVGAEFVPEGSLGRVSEGMTSEETQTRRRRAIADIQRGEQAVSRRVRALQAAQGVRGGAAVAQQAQIATEAQRSRAAAETELFLAGEQQRREDVRFNLDQAARERFAQLSTGVTLGQLGTVERAAETSAAASIAAAQAQSGGGGGTVICTELHRQGLMTREVYKADQKYGNIMWMQKPEVMIGYHAWAKPLVQKMQKSKLLTLLVYICAKPWANHMSHKMGLENKTSMIGSITAKIGEKLCEMYGKHLLKSAVKKEA